MGLTAICRNFAPLYGIDEESATGTSNCALACYLYRYVSKQDQYIFEQGHNLNSISRIYVNLDTEDNTITGVWVEDTDICPVCHKSAVSHEPDHTHIQVYLKIVS